MGKSGKKEIPDDIMENTTKQKLKIGDYSINQDGGWDIGHGMKEDWDEGGGEVLVGAETTELELPMLFSVSLGGKFLANDDGGIWNAQGRFFSQAVID